MLGAYLHYLHEALPATNLGWLVAHLRREWIDQAVQATDRASIRKRCLPAEQVVWLVIALALYRHQSIGEVVDDLDLALWGQSRSFVSKSTVMQVRQPTGQEQLAWLFEKTVQAWTVQDAEQHAFKGLSLWPWPAHAAHRRQPGQMRTFRRSGLPQRQGIELSAGAGDEPDGHSDASGG